MNSNPSEANSDLQNSNLVDSAGSNQANNSTTSNESTESSSSNDAVDSNPVDSIEAEVAEVPTTTTRRSSRLSSKKRILFTEIDSDVDDEEEKVVTAKPPRKKKRSAKTSDDQDEDYNEVTTATGDQDIALPPLAINKKKRTAGGSPRMHLATAFRLEGMGLYEALIAGGFTYAKEDMNLLDDEGVSLRSRKHNLTRRVRIAKAADPPKHDKNDPKMLLAIAARLEDPEMSPHTALLRGGYTFTVRPKGGNDFSVFDSEGTSLGHLKRRLDNRYHHYRRATEAQINSESKLCKEEPGEESDGKMSASELEEYKKKHD